MKYTKYIVLNGPPMSGKSTIARELSQYMNERHIETVSDSFAAPMKHYISTALGMQYASMPKDAPRAELSGYSVREFLIDLSENYIKPRYGDGVYGRWLSHRIGRIQPSPSFVICDDGGFTDEVDALGAGKAIIVRVNRPGKDFSNDSRSYLDNPHYTFDNDGDMAVLWTKTRALALHIIAGHVHGQ